MNRNPLLMTDGYKTSHHKMYPEGTSLVYSNFTPRSVKYMPEKAKDIVVFGTQYVVRSLHELWEQNFFAKKKSTVVGEAKTFLSSYLGTDYDVSHFEALHDLGYLPVIIKSLPEGTIIDEKVPLLTIYNTHPDFYWVPNFLETYISSLIWKPLHSASLALAFKKLFLKAAKETDKDNIGFVDFQGHDFSFRGMQHPESAISSGLGWLTSFKGTDTIPALQAAQQYYDSQDAGFSVPASEHAVMTAYGKEDEICAFKRLMQQYPTGVLSVVSDSFDLWKVCTEYLVELKDDILARDGKIVIRPDSGNPAHILCGYSGKFNDDYVNPNTPAGKGVIELLWDVFGGTINEQGYKVLDPHIGAIYGDSITLERAIEINERLKAKGFASTNWVAGIGSYSLGYATRDSQGSAVKATYVEIEQTGYPNWLSPEATEPASWTEGRNIFKDPITDDGTKKSATGLLQVYQLEGAHGLSKPMLKDKCTWEEEGQGMLRIIYKDGVLENQENLEDIRERINKNLK